MRQFNPVRIVCPEACRELVTCGACKLHVLLSIVDYMPSKTASLRAGDKCAFYLDLGYAFVRHLRAGQIESLYSTGTQSWSSLDRLLLRPRLLLLLLLVHLRPFRLRPRLVLQVFARTRHLTLARELLSRQASKLASERASQPVSQRDNWQRKLASELSSGYRATGELSIDVERVHLQGRSERLAG